MKTELVTTLKRQAARLLSDLRKSGEPVLITEHGKPAAYLVDVDSYEFMQQRMAVLEGIARGVDVLDGHKDKHCKEHDNREVDPRIEIQQEDVERVHSSMRGRARGGGGGGAGEARPRRPARATGAVTTVDTVGPVSAGFGGASAGS